MCVYNKVTASRKQITVAVHVDDLLVTCADADALDAFSKMLRSYYPHVTRNQGSVINYVGMTFDFCVAGEVSITMSNMVADVLHGCGDISPKSTLAGENLFEVREEKEVEALNNAQTQFFHTKVAQYLYLAKRARPECLTAVAFTRVTAPDKDDLGKLRRLLGYLMSDPERVNT